MGETFSKPPPGFSKHRGPTAQEQAAAAALEQEQQHQAQIEEARQHVSYELEGEEAAGSGEESDGEGDKPAEQLRLQRLKLASCVICHQECPTINRCQVIPNCEKKFCDTCWAQHKVEVNEQAEKPLDAWNAIEMCQECAVEPHLDIDVTFSDIVKR